MGDECSSEDGDQATGNRQQATGKSVVPHELVE